MYPGTIFNWYDESAINPSVPQQAPNTPLYMAVSSFDRGPEDLRLVYGQEFYSLYGNTMSFKKHGQPAIQCANVIDGGAQLLVKRLVADDATLANAVYILNVTSKITANKTTDVENEKAVFLQDITGQPSTSTDKYLVDPTKSEVTFYWEVQAFEGCKTIDDVKKEAEKLYKPGTPATDGTDTVTVTNTAVLPMLVVTDNGRGLSYKSFKIEPDYFTSKNSNDMFYTITTYNKYQRLETGTVTYYPKTVVNNTLYGITQDSSDQVQLYQYIENYNSFLNTVCMALGAEAKKVRQYDIMFGTDNKNARVKGIKLDRDKSVDLKAEYGISLVGGTNGEFGDSPWDAVLDTWKETGLDEDRNNDTSKLAPWTKAALEVFDEDNPYDAIIWDVDRYKIYAIFDANYPIALKLKIDFFVNYREDCVFFRDLGTKVDSFLSIMEVDDQFDELQGDKSRYIADYFTTYEIYDPYTRERERVTMMYDFARACIAHFSLGAYRPLAGTANNMILPSAIKNTLNFTPRVLPKHNQKAMIDDARINYAIFEANGNCVVQSLYTSQSLYSQLSYVNNVLGIQEVVRAVRDQCPKSRFTFVSGSDFSFYATAVNNVLQGFTDHFAELTMEYQQDSVKAMQKIFYAVINFRFNNWAQSEVFDLYALPNIETTTE